MYGRCRTPNLGGPLGRPLDFFAATAGIRASPFSWVDPTKIPRRQWLYGRHYIRKVHFRDCRARRLRQVDPRYD